MIKRSIFQHSGLAAALIGLTVLTACDRNPVLGKWQATGQASAAQEALGKQVEFTSGMMTPSGGVWPSMAVQYKHEGDKWFVVVAQGPAIVAQVSGDRLQIQLPMMGAATYRKTAQ
ncbi:hypothetical protein [Nitrospirillum sp. BR 11163]|uniref:hypothetical protein n=1 Tax=Nitrospirillum sp. BR 11163 TaxID=3104323 RepID=UPI002AFEBE3F|nr:hypothetical protein [Nitrospirillum sp. BR 11163]MEA1675481.1 hypothetical protein [Nitrospirillum sp. BR 11163]